MLPPEKPIHVNAMNRKIDVDNRIPLRNYYRIAYYLLRQASICRAEKNIKKLYIILSRYLSLVTEITPSHQDYRRLFLKDKMRHKMMAFTVLDEIEDLKPTFQCLVHELKQIKQSDQIGSSLYEQNTGHTQVLQPCTVDTQFRKSLPKQETLKRHSVLGPYGFRGKWLGPRAKIKVRYPSKSKLTSLANLVWRNQTADYDSFSIEDVLSLDNGVSMYIESNNDNLPLSIIRQPSPPPVLAHVQPEYHHIPPSRVADPRPGPAKPVQDGISSSNPFKNLHLPFKIMANFLRLARTNTENNLETCGILAGSLKNKVFHITSLIIPKQMSTSDSCQTLNEEEIFDVQDKHSLVSLGWIHTHPTQTCFMSSVDLHTHYSYQIMLPEAIAIVMAPTDTSSPYGIFHLSNPGGVSLIRNCRQRGFHPHKELDDGSPIYEHCSHVYLNDNSRFDVIDLRG